MSEQKTDLSGIQFESERLESGNKELREKYEAVVEALGDILASYEQYGEMPSDVITKAKSLLP